MFEYKLQIGCLIAVLYFIAVYLKSTVKTSIPCNRIFDALLVITPWAIIFDGVTAWTVNHMDIVPEWVNLLLHELFFVSMNIVTILVFVYMVNQMIGIESKKMKVLLFLPGIVSTLSIIVTINKLYYVHGKTTNYSMGTPVVCCFASLFVHFLYIFILICWKHKTLEKRKIFSVISFMVISLAILVVQILLPETLISSLLPMIAIVGIYMNFENPSLKRLHRYNEEMVTGFATLVENRDNSTGGHIRRTKGYVRIILKEMKKHHKYRKMLTKAYINNVMNAAPMHDIGKIATPDHILQKPGKLTDEEYDEMKKHAAIGGDIIKETFADLDEPEYQQIAYEVARHHHEKWNGKGYPDGLKGEQIPLHARVMAIADVFDAVSAKRCYRDAMPIEKCFSIIEEGAGTDFDPGLVSMFMDAREIILDYYEKEKD